MALQSQAHCLPRDAQTYYEWRWLIWPNRISPKGAKTDPRVPLLGSSQQGLNTAPWDEKNKAMLEVTSQPRWCWSRSNGARETTLNSCWFLDDSSPSMVWVINHGWRKTDCSRAWACRGRSSLHIKSQEDNGPITSQAELTIKLLPILLPWKVTRRSRRWCLRLWSLRPLL